MNRSFPQDFISAASEYSWLLSRSYPQKAVLKLVGDKYMLPGDMRQVLYRGVSADQAARSRKSKIGAVRAGDRVLVDAYNVLFTVNNYLLGKPLFISNDGILRDAGEMRGRITNKPVFTRSVCLMLDVLRLWNSATFILYLDEPVSFSGRLAIELSKDMVQMEIEGEALAVRSPDQKLLSENSDAICTSDSAIIDRYTGRVVDLPRYLLEKFFDPAFPSLDL